MHCDYDSCQFRTRIHVTSDEHCIPLHILILRTTYCASDSRKNGYLTARLTVVSGSRFCIRHVSAESENTAALYGLKRQLAPRQVRNRCANHLIDHNLMNL